jgi:hypothetical protein
MQSAWALYHDMRYQGARTSSTGQTQLTIRTSREKAGKDICDRVYFFPIKCCDSLRLKKRLCFSQAINLVEKICPDIGLVRLVGRSRLAGQNRCAKDVNRKRITLWLGAFCKILERLTERNLRFRPQGRPKMKDQ